MSEMLSRWAVGLALVLALAAAPAQARTASLVVDAASGAVLHAEQPNALWYPASLTKMVTAYLVFEALESGRLSLDQSLTISEQAAAQPPTKLGLRAGDKIDVELALRAMIVRSANDAAVVLAEALAGSEADFAGTMTAKARALGMDRTRFFNATGLPNEAQVTTARDMAVLALALLRDFPQHYHFFGEDHVIFGGKRKGTTNGWLTAFAGAEGGKTGFTCASGYNLVGSAERGGRRLVGVVLGGTTRGERNGELSKLLNAAFKKPDKTIATLAALDDQDVKIVPPPQVLAWRDCVRGSPAVQTASVGNLPGWGVVFGAFVTETEAKDVIGQNRSTLKPVVSRGRPAVIERARDGARKFSALLVDLAREDAGKACKYLWQVGAYCLALPPDQLNNPEAIWR